MESHFLTFVKKKPRLAFGTVATLTLTLIAGGFAGFVLYGDLIETRAQFAETKTTLEGTISEFEESNKNLSEALYSEQQKNKQHELQIQYITKTVGILEKWRQLDPELLLKYSKVYFLSENYVPSELSAISDRYLTEERISDVEDTDIHARVLPPLERMLNDAKNNGMDIKVASAYRSFGTQSSLKSDYSLVYGAGTANQFSADQGYSEHQLGTAVDLTTPDTARTLEGFEKTKEYAWLLKNAHRYGFTLSYPEGNSYYVFEPWHWRFVGQKLATHLHDNELRYYDMDQREIDQYLINIFD
ncbi:MAG TPA: M15 family metallopeptidase [Candidatus Paceibacterota bacterium]